MMFLFWKKGEQGKFLNLSSCPDFIQVKDVFILGKDLKAGKTWGSSLLPVLSFLQETLKIPVHNTNLNP